MFKTYSSKASISFVDVGDLTSLVFRDGQWIAFRLSGLYSLVVSRRLLFRVSAALSARRHLEMSSPQSLRLRESCKHRDIVCERVIFLLGSKY